MLSTVKDRPLPVQRWGVRATVLTRALWIRQKNRPRLSPSLTSSKQPRSEDTLLLCSIYGRLFQGFGGGVLELLFFSIRHRVTVTAFYLIIIYTLLQPGWLAICLNLIIYLFLCVTQPNHRVVPFKPLKLEFDWATWLVNGFILS